jgi:hypothetical protein
MQQSYTPLHLYSPMLRPCRRQTAAALRGLLRLGCRRLLHRLWLADKSTHQCFQHTEPTQQTKGSQQS